MNVGNRELAFFCVLDAQGGKKRKKCSRRVAASLKDVQLRHDTGEVVS